MATYAVTVTTDEGTTVLHGIEAASAQEACDVAAALRGPGGAASYTANEE